MQETRLLNLLKALGLGAYITMMGDEHLNEFVGEADQKIKFLTNFSGSSGTAVTASKSILYTDGRYAIQAKDEARGYEVSEKSFIKNAPAFIKEHAENRRVGVYLKQISSRSYEALKEAMEDAGLILVPFDNDLVDEVWPDRPPREYKGIVSLESVKMGSLIDEKWISRNSEEHNPNRNPSGSSYLDKLEQVRQILKHDETLLVTDLDTIAWLFNLRGSDIEHQSTFYSYAYITQKKAYLFAAEKVDLEEVTVKKYEEFYDFLEDIRSNSVVISGDCNAYIYGRLRKASYTRKVQEMKSRKNSTELLGFRYAGDMDGVALTKLFSWLDRHVSSGITEAAVARKLVEIKRNIKGFVTPSFFSIVSFGPNSAVIHHRPGETVVSRESMLMLDTGSHYFYGTTDITRTIHLGYPSPEMKRHYTLVVKGWLGARNLRGERILASEVDSMARKYLAEEGYEYDTATGHGVGHFLGVHERPPAITEGNKYELQRNQVFSIEPGFYKEGLYGIRIEDLVYYTGSKDMHYLETLTFVPLALNLIDKRMLSSEQLGWLDDYSATVYRRLKPLLEDDEDALAYLRKNTRELASEDH
jgi:Xaa-Pro aminopeptidase